MPGRRTRKVATRGHTNAVGLKVNNAQVAYTLAIPKFLWGVLPGDRVPHSAAFGPPGEVFLFLAIQEIIMAMLEHECIDCKKFWANNQQEPFCPRCGSTRLRSTSDESADHMEGQLDGTRD